MTSRLANAPTEPRVIAWEIRRKARYELIDGEVRMMAGGSGRTTWWPATSSRRCISRYPGPDCDVHGSSLKTVGMVTLPRRVRALRPARRRAVRMRRPRRDPRGALPTMRSEDPVIKRWGYQTIPTLAHLVYVDASRIRIEIATRAPDGRWSLQSGLNAKNQCVTSVFIQMPNHLHKGIEHDKAKSQSHGPITHGGFQHSNSLFIGSNEMTKELHAPSG